MPRIYLTCRTEDTAHREFEQVYLRLVQAFGEGNILRTAGSGSGDVLYLANLVRSCDALVVVTGRFWLNMMDETGRRLLDDPFDYLYTELNTALSDDEKWVTLLLVDNTTAPESDELPEGLRGLLRRDQVSVAADAELDTALDDLVERIGMAAAGIPAEEAPPARVTVIHTDAPPSESIVREKSSQSGTPSASTGKKSSPLSLLVLLLVILLPYICTGLSDWLTQAYQEDNRQERDAVIATNNFIRGTREGEQAGTATMAVLARTQSFATNQAFLRALTATQAVAIDLTQRADNQTQTADVPTIAALTATTSAIIVAETATHAAVWENADTTDIISTDTLPRLAQRFQFPITGTVRQLSFSPDGTVFAQAKPNRMFIYSSATHQQVRILQVSDLLGMAFRPDSTEIAWFDSNGVVHLQDYMQPKETASLSPAFQIAFVGHDLLVTAGAGGLYQVRDIRAGDYNTIVQQQENFFIHKMAINSGSYAWAFMSGNLRLEFVAEDEQKYGITLNDPPGFLHDMQLSPDGKLLALLTGDLIQVYRVQLEPVLLLELPGFTSQKMAFSPESDLLAASTADGYILFFDLKSDRAAVSIKAHTGSIHALAFSPDGRQLLSAGDDSTVRLWQVLP